MYVSDLAGTRRRFADLKTLLARASPDRSGDRLAGVAAESAEERIAARYTLADLPLTAFLSQAVIPYEDDEIIYVSVHPGNRNSWGTSPETAMTVTSYRGQPSQKSVPRMNSTTGRNLVNIRCALGDTA